MSDNLHESNDFFNENLTDGCHLATDAETANWLLDDGPVLKSTWMIYDRQFPDGQREICATKSVRIKQTGPLGMSNRAKRGESEKRSENDEDSAKRAKQAVRLRCKAISADRMITLTLRENMQDRPRMAGYFDAFRRRMSKLGKFHYVAVIEAQQRGSLHMHIAVHGRQAYDVVRAIWQRVVGKDERGNQMAQVHVRNPNDFFKTRSRGASKHNKELQHLIAAYISKYITKDQDNHDLNKKRYWTSRGIVVPEKNYYQLEYGADAHDAFVHVMQLAADHNSAGMVFFSNHALGVCWVATAPS